LPNIDQFSTFFHWLTLWTICYKTIFNDFTTHKKVSIHDLVKYKFSKIAPTDAQQWQTKRT